jgi:competence protein ComEC
VALARLPEAIEEDCRAADLVVSYPRIEWCPGNAPLIGPRTLRRAGGLAIWVERSGIDIRTVREGRGERPWSRSAVLTPRGAAPRSYNRVAP